jgi:hypothetical protein
MITSNDRPRLREDLVAEAIEDRGARFVDVIDPDNGNSYRFYDIEYSLACAMDGERDIPGLVRWAQEELGIAPSPRELETVISTLGDLGYLDRVDSARPGLATGVVAAAVAAPSSGIDVELGHYRPPSWQAEHPAAAHVEPALELELGAAGSTGDMLEIEEASPEVALGAAGAVVPSLPVPTPAAARQGAPRPRTDTPVGEGRRAASSAEPLVPMTANRPSERHVRSGRPTEQGVRPSEPMRGAPEPVRASQPKLRPSEQQVRGAVVSDPSLSLSLPLRPDDVKEAVRASREMRSVDVPPELMQALEAAEQPASAPVRSRPATTPPIAASALPPTAPVRPSAVASMAMPSAAVLDPITPLSASSPFSVSEPISPPSVPPLVPAPRADSRSEVRAPEPMRARSEPRSKASEPRLEYPRAEARPAESRPAESRPALTPAPRELAPPVATPLPDVVAPRRSGSIWIVAVLLVAIVAVVAFGVWKFVINKKAVEPAPVTTTEPAVKPGTPGTPGAVTPAEPPPPPKPTAKLSLVKGPSISVKMPVAGALQSIVADGTVVKEADEVARLGGGKVPEQRILEARGDLDKRYPADIERLKAKLAAAPNNRQVQTELANREARVVQRTKELEAYQAELNKFVIRAPGAGKITVMAKAGARLAAEAEVVSIEPEPYLNGAADLGKPSTAAAGDLIDVKLKGDGATATAQCTLEAVQGSKVSFRCPMSEGFGDGAEVTIEAK